MMRETTVLSMLTLLSVTLGQNLPRDTRSLRCWDLYTTTCHRQFIDAGFCEFLVDHAAISHWDISPAEKRVLEKNLWRQTERRIISEISRECGDCHFHLEEDDFERDCFGSPTPEPTPVPTREDHCCHDWTAECHACEKGETIEELCAYEPYLPGCFDDPKGISSGAIAGIVIGAVLLLSVFLGLVYFCYIRKDNNVASPDARPPSNPPPQLV